MDKESGGARTSVQNREKEGIDGGSRPYKDASNRVRL